MYIGVDIPVEDESKKINNDKQINEYLITKSNIFKKEPKTSLVIAVQHQPQCPCNNNSYATAVQQQPTTVQQCNHVEVVLCFLGETLLQRLKFSLCDPRDILQCNSIAAVWIVFSQTWNTASIVF